MLASTHPGSAGSILRSAIKSIEEIVNRLEYAGRVGGDHWPLAGKLHGLDCLRLDLNAAAAGDGLIGADVYELVAQAHAQLIPAVEAHDQGDLDPWRSGREAVQATLHQLRELFEPQLDAELVARSAVVAAPAPRPAPAGTMPAVHLDVDPGRKGEKAEKGLAVQTGRGRKKTPIEEGAPFRAAFWMHDAPDLIPDDQRELRSAMELLGPHPRPQDVFELLRRHGLTIMLSSVRNRVPPCWPRTPDGRSLPSWAFADYAVDVNAESFARAIRRHAKAIQGAAALDRHGGAVGADFKKSVDHAPRSPHGPTPQEIRRRTIIAGAMGVEEALARVNAAVRSGRDDPAAWDALRETMVQRMRLQADAVDELLAGRDADTVDRVGALLVKMRKRAGDDGDCDPDGRLK